MSPTAYLQRTPQGRSRPDHGGEGQGDTACGQEAPTRVAWTHRGAANPGQAGVVAQLTMKSIVSRLNEKELGTSYFDNIEEAQKWLHAQP
jgi:hypothetical protein